MTDDEKLEIVAGYARWVRNLAIGLFISVMANVAMSFELWQLQ